MRPEAQIKSYIEDALRSSVPKLTLDELFEKRMRLPLPLRRRVQRKWQKKWQLMVYVIVKTLITKVEPDAEVKQSMNEINAAQRM